MSLRLILVGKSGEGKSATGNTLLGEEKFEAKESANAVTTQCKLVKDDRFEIIDTPGLCDSSTTFRERALEIQRSVEICKKPHAFLLIIKMGRITTDTKFTIDMLRIIFGEEFSDHCIVVFTHRCKKVYCINKRPNETESSVGSEENCGENKPSVEDKELMTFIKDNPVLKPIVKRCQYRVLCIENKAKNQCRTHTRENMVKQIIRMVNSISENGNNLFNNRYINYHRNVLEDSRNPCDNIVNEIIILQEAINVCIDRARLENEKREEKQREEQKAIIGSIAGAVGGFALALAGGAVDPTFGPAVGGVLGNKLLPAVSRKLLDVCYRDKHVKKQD